MKNRRNQRPQRKSKAVYGAVKGRQGSFWTRIGTAFENQDGSWNLVMNFWPTDPETTIQMRDKFVNDDDAEGSEEGDEPTNDTEGDDPIS